MTHKLKIGIGLSGGTDSSFAAFLLKQQSCDVHAFTMRLQGNSAAVAKGRRVAEKLDIPFQVLELQDRFEELVLTPFVESYARGLTPSPCVLCNRDLKFGLMGQAILDSGCDLLATGHYARLKTAADGSVRLLRGIDAGKEQSYFLAQLSQEQLGKACFPLGEWRKEDVIRQAKARQLVPENESESQDLCFLPDRDFAALVAARHPELQREGWIMDESGRKLGRHNGAFRYTYGQRQGLGLGGGPWFVSHINIPDNLVIVTHAKAVMSRQVYLRSMNWLPSPPLPGEGVECQAQVRYNMKARDAHIVAIQNGCARLEFNDPVSAVTPGQLAVCYRGEEVLASGWIEVNNGSVAQ